MSSFPVRRASPAQEKSKPCHSKAAVVGNRNGEKAGRTLRSSTRVLPGEGGERIGVEAVNTCLYCSREFVGSKGLSLHLNHCKFKSIFDIPECHVVLEDIAEHPEFGGSDETFSLENQDRLCLTESSVQACNSGSVLTSQDNLHGALSRKTRDSEAKVLSRISRKLPIRWPRMGDTGRWNEFQEQVESQIPDHWLTVKRKIELLEIVAYEEAKLKFGVISDNPKKSILTRRQQEILKCRSNLNSLQKAWLHSCSEEEQGGISLL